MSQKTLNKETHKDETFITIVLDTQGDDYRRSSDR